MSLFAHDANGEILEITIMLAHVAAFSAFHVHHPVD